MELSTLLVKLSGFSSIFEVAIGINLVFSVWNQLRDYALNAFNEKVNARKVSLQARFGDVCLNTRTYQKLESKINSRQLNLSRLSKAAKWLGLIIAVFLIILLICIGINQGLEVTGVMAIWLCVLSLLPSTLLLCLGHFYVFYSLSKVDGYIEQQEDALSDLETKYKRTIG